LNGKISISNPKAVLEINAFTSCAFTQAYLNCPAANIGSNAFAGSGLTSIYIGPNATGWTLGSGQTIGGKSGITVASWSTFPATP
jgi:hypothetical protein